MKFLLALILTHGITNEPTTDASIVFGSPMQTGKWELTPEVIVCPHAPVSKERVEEAVNFWKKLGYTIGDVVAADEKDFSCSRNIVLHGDILINLPGQDFRMSKYLATTRTWIEKDSRRILKAKIEVMGGWGDAERIMEHEIGHALGWRDYNQTGHIMHSNWSMGGYNTKGVKNETSI